MPGVGEYFCGTRPGRRCPTAKIRNRIKKMQNKKWFLNSTLSQYEMSFQTHISGGFESPWVQYFFRTFSEFTGRGWSNVGVCGRIVEVCGSTLTSSVCQNVPLYADMASLCTNMTYLCQPLSASICSPTTCSHNTCSPTTCSTTTFSPTPVR
jgi:hypothetical protein